MQLGLWVAALISTPKPWTCFPSNEKFGFLWFPHSTCFLICEMGNSLSESPVLLAGHGPAAARAGKSYCPHILDEETDAQSCPVICPTSEAEAAGGHSLSDAGALIRTTAPSALCVSQPVPCGTPGLAGCRLPLSTMGLCPHYFFRLGRRHRPAGTRPGAIPGSLDAHMAPGR